MKINAILFDIDGTLIDSNDMHVLAWEEAFAGIGETVERPLLHDQIGKGADMLVPALLPHLDAEAQKELGEVQGAVFTAKFLRRALPFVGARDLLAHVHARGQQVVFASSASAPEVNFYLDLLDAHGLVGATTSGDEVKRTKPAPDIFATALAKARVGSEQAIVVGDTPYDMEAANKCGIAAVALRSGNFTDDRLWNASAIAIYEDAADLLTNYDISPLSR